MRDEILAEAPNRRDGPPTPIPFIPSDLQATIDGGMPTSPENGSTGSSRETSIRSSHPPGGRGGVPPGVVVVIAASPSVLDLRCLDDADDGGGECAHPGGWPAPLRTLRWPGVIRGGDPRR